MTEKQDICERLRHFFTGWKRLDDLSEEAADEIERLRAALSNAKQEAWEEAAKVVEHYSLPTIQTPSMWLVDKASIAHEIRALSKPEDRHE